MQSRSSHCLFHKLFVNLCRPSCLLADDLCNADQPNGPALTCSNLCVNKSLQVYGRKISNWISGLYLASMTDRRSLMNGSRLLIPALIFHPSFKSLMTFCPACIASKLQGYGRRLTMAGQIALADIHYAGGCRVQVAQIQNCCRILDYGLQLLMLKCSPREV